VKIPDEILFERKRRARELFESSRVFRHQQNWNEAASCIRLAIAFDPWTDDYKEAFGDVLANLAQMRAEKLIEQAMDTSDGRSQKEALNLLEEAIMYRPSDPEIQHRAAELSMAGDELEQAREYAERSVELEPEGAVYHLTLSKVLRRLGQRQKAQSVAQTARKLDPSNPEILEELRRLRQRPGRSSGGMI
jgi:tetratricopeptide (TPR) repeat protein